MFVVVASMLTPTTDILVVYPPVRLKAGLKATWAQY